MKHIGNFLLCAMLPLIAAAYFANMHYGVESATLINHISAALHSVWIIVYAILTFAAPVAAALSMGFALKEVKLNITPDSEKSAWICGAVSAAALFAILWHSHILVSILIAVLVMTVLIESKNKAASGAVLMGIAALFLGLCLNAAYTSESRTIELAKNYSTSTKAEQAELDAYLQDKLQDSSSNFSGRMWMMNEAVTATPLFVEDGALALRFKDDPTYSFTCMKNDKGDISLRHNRLGDISQLFAFRVCSIRSSEY